ncbi:MAG: gamma-glutamyl-gamma-aminobutyrate hydrolase family protein [Candidatus Promineifilaceae bacterium]|nr:gamma-glutamyl-gamma-aminobutyrate hydrolase family protein [Candidatus Promineifilaceae bacterium]
MDKRRQKSRGSIRPIIGITTYRKYSQDTNRPLFGIMRDYVHAVTAGGGVPVLIPLGLAEEDLLLIVERLDGLLLPGGGDIEPEFYHGFFHEKLRGIDVDRDRVEIYVAQQATRLKKPFLAICRGHQILNVALGGTMWEDVASQYPNPIDHDFWGKGMRNHLQHPVDITPDSHLATIVGRESMMVNSLHHQGVKDIAPDLLVSAIAPDGLVEGLEVAGHPFGVAVQWHPENLIEDDPAMLALFEALVHASQNGSN